MEEVNDIILMQPTSPLRRVSDIENIIRLRRDTGRISAVSVKEVSEYPEWMFRKTKDNLFNYIFNV